MSREHNTQQRTEGKDEPNSFYGVDMRSRENAIEILNSASVLSPPHELRLWVGGPNSQVFEEIGKTLALNLFDVIEPLNILNSSEANVLDFGCGCGRLFRYFHFLYPKARYYGVDPDPTGINWCKENLSDLGTFVQSSTHPPLPLDQKFDFVYATSVFTHLPENLQFLWLEELHRVTNPGAYLIISTHGENIQNNPTSLTDEEKEIVAKNGFCYRDTRNNLIGADYYDIVWHSVDYIKNNWSRYFEIVRHIDKGLNNHQDLILLKRP
jgi:SAM-dependent methyltransferase